MTSSPHRFTWLLTGMLVSGGIAAGADQPPRNSTSRTPPGIQAEGVSRVAAQVIDSKETGRSQPQRQAGAFRIPVGSIGTNLEYRYRDPNLDYSSSRLTGSNIYSITENRYLRELEFVPIYRLPPGDYQFEVGGMPGAHGELTVSIVPGNPPTTTTVTQTPTTTDDTAQKPPQDQEVSDTLKALDRAWSGQYTIEKVTGNMEGLGAVLGRRHFSVKMRPDNIGFSAEGAVWIPPGRFGWAAGGLVQQHRVINFYVASKETDRGSLLISFKGVYDPQTNSLKGTLIGNMVQGDSSNPVFEGSWYLKPR
jgi:hypothetical protein